jgi:hypothetical protein
MSVFFPLTNGSRLRLARRGIFLKKTYKAAQYAKRPLAAAAANGRFTDKIHTAD